MNWHTRVRDAFAADGHVPDGDIVEELGQHAASAFQTARADGVAQEPAEHQVDALIEAWVADGGVLRRRPRRPAVIEPPVPSRPSHASFAGVLQDARYGIRLLRREPGFMVVAILTMALGIGATTTLFSVAYGVLLKPLPWPDAERLVRITEARGGRIGRVRGTMMNGSFLAWADHPTTIDALAGWRRQVMTMIVGGGEPGRVPVIPLTPSAFPMLRARPLVGRVFAAAGGNPVGATVPNLGMCRGDSDRWQVVGVVDDMRQGPVTDAPQPEVFIPVRQIGCTNAAADPVVLVRTAADPSAYAPLLRDLLREQAPSLALDSVMTMDDRVVTSLARPRTYALLLGGFAMFALAIAGVGLFGVLSYSVAQRTREIGVRTALGAQTRDIVRLVFRQGLAIAGAGVALGLLMSAAAVRSLSAFLYGVAAYDAASFIVVPVVLAAVAVVACLVPARRAASIDPLRALRGF